MPDTRHRTVVEIGVDDREVRGLGQTMERAFSTRTVEAFERSIERTGRAMEKLTQAQARLIQQMARMEQAVARQERGPGAPAGAPGGPGAPGGAGGARRGGGGFGGTFGGSFAGTAAANLLTRAGGMAGAMAQPQGFVGQMVSGIPYIGPALGGAANAVQQLYGEFASRQIARSRAFGVTGIGGGAGGGYGGLAGVGTRYGIGPTEFPGTLAGLSQQTGMRGAELAGAVPSLLRMQQTMGFGNIASIVGGAGAAGGTGEDVYSIILDAVTSGVQAGFREGRLDQFFQQFAARTRHVGPRPGLRR
jgi:hypothetical protein